jgi:hypothetical protein
MKKILMFVIAIVGYGALTFGQIDKMRDQLDDSSAEQEGMLTLRFFNAETGDPVPDAIIKIQDGETYTTDMEGKVRFKKLPDGIYPFHFDKPGFIPENNKFELIAGTLFRNRFIVTPAFEIGSIRIVLDWDAKPKDLDAHFVKEGGYHISYHDMKTSSDGTARLDRDDQDGFGPETITVKDIDDGAEYTFYVKDFSNKDSKNSKQLSKSKAMVKIYEEGELKNIWQLSDKQKGNTWMVFSIHNGKLVPTDEVNNYY